MGLDHCAKCSTRLDLLSREAADDSLCARCLLEAVLADLLVTRTAPLLPQQCFCGRPFSFLDGALLCEACGIRLTSAAKPSLPPRDLPPDVTEAERNPVSRFGRYIKIRPLGEGGFAAVHLAYDTQLGRYVALKILRGADPVFAARFAREAYLHAQLRHPNIVTVHDFGHSNGVAYFAMDYVDGKDAARLSLDDRGAAALVRDAARAVDYAHKQDVVHRDLKPSNLMLDARGHLYVMDFGLARSSSQHEAPISRSGSVVGTPAFMAPEQAEGHVHVDARADVYGLGATLYTLVTAQAPFEGTTAEILRKIVTEEPMRPRRTKRAIPADLETIILKAMDKDPRRRYVTAAALADDLERFLRGEPIVAKPASLASRLVKRARRNPAAASLACLLFVLIFGAATFFAGRASLRAHELGRLRAEAERARASGSWEDGLSAVAAALRLDPDDPELAGLQKRMRAGQKASEGAQLLARYEQTAKELAETAARRKAIEADTPPSTPPSRLEELRQARTRESALRLQAQEFLRQSEETARAAREFWPEELEALRVLGAVFNTRLSAAHESRNFNEIETLGEQVRAAGLEGRSLALRSPARVSLVVESALGDSGAAYLFVYRERQDRLVPFPYNAGRKTLKDVGLPSVDPLPVLPPEDEARRARERTSYPLECSEFNRLGPSGLAAGIELPAGRYLLVVESTGRLKVAYPLALLPGERHTNTLRLPLEGAFPKEFIFVPAGPFVAGLDPFALNHADAREEGTRTVSDYALSRFEVTCGEYLGFLNDRGYHTLEQAVSRAPRQTRTGNPYWTVKQGKMDLAGWHPDFPVVGISWHDAVEYAKWLTQSLGNGRWTFRLPTEDEWEKAARGVDGRWFPWGNTFVPTFCASLGARTKAEGQPYPQKYGLFPADESCYGVRDLAGGVPEWTTTISGYRNEWRVIKGGGGNRDAPYCRAAFRYHDDAEAVGAQGFRLVAVPR